MSVCHVKPQNKHKDCSVEVSFFGITNVIIQLFAPEGHLLVKGSAHLCIQNQNQIAY